MMGIAFVGFIVLIVYSAWMSYNWVKEKGKAVETAEELRITKNVLIRETEARAIEKSSFESRLSAKQGEIEALKKYILTRISGNNSAAVDFIVMSEKTDEPSGDA